MGASNSLPVTSKLTDEGENDIIKYAASSMQGWRETMDDAHTAILDLKGSTFFGVYDGHRGCDVAWYCAEQFHAELVKEADYDNNLVNAIKRVCFRIDEKLLKSNTSWWFDDCDICPYEDEGSTACVVLIRNNQIIVGNVGDSRCVLSRSGQAIDLSTDHKPNHPSEIKRIRRAGGLFHETRISQVSCGKLRGNTTLTISRAIGVFDFKMNDSLPPARQMVTCDPDVCTVDITDDAEFLVIATDGIWDCMSSQNVVDFIRQRLQSGVRDVRLICENLLDACLASKDNATAILVLLKTGARIPPPPCTKVDHTTSANTWASHHQCQWTGTQLRQRILLSKNSSDNNFAVKKTEMV